MTTAFVSGATGFIAQHLIKLLLSKGFKVVGSVRSEAKGQHLKWLLESNNFDYVVVSEVAAPGAFDEALKAHPDVNVFFHTASPVYFPERDFEELVVRPAIHGTVNALKAAHEYGKNLTRFVLTSSNVAALGTGLVSEETWTDIARDAGDNDRSQAYVVSKTYGEKEAWKFIEEEKPSFKFTAVLPSVASGPQAFSVKETLNASSEIFGQFLKLKPTDPLPTLQFPYFDVRDVAKAHLVAYEEDRAINQRLLLQNGYFSSQLIANTIRKNFPELRESVPEGDPSRTEESLQHPETVDNFKTLSLLGFIPRDIEKSLVDAIRQILEAKK